MKLRITKPIILSATLALTALVWATAFRYSITNAVTAGAQHFQTAMRAPPDSATNDPSVNNVVTVSFMNRGYCYAGSQLKDTKAPGGFGKSDNAPQKLRTESPGRGLFLLAQPGVVASFANGPGMRVVLVNQTQELLAFPASDSRVAIIQEAVDADGTWKPIEYLPSSGCGNSYHRVFLAPGYFWAFSAPRYKGSIPTKLRFAMALADGSQFHSNEFEGSVNPEQFSVEKGHVATNIMDPYNE